MKLLDQPNPGAEAPGPNNSKAHLVVMHQNPDPDALGAALGMACILRKQGVEQIHIVYKGEISHPMNKSMVNMFSLPVRKVESVDPSEYDKIICVDCRPSHTGLVSVGDVDMIVDHHKGDEGSDIPNSVIKPCGATSSLVCHMLDEDDLLEDEGEQMETTRSCLLLGIYTDTDNFLKNLSEEDFTAYRRLSGLVEEKRILQILEYPIPPYIFELEAQAVAEDNYRIVGSTYIAGVGVLADGRRDALPFLADKLLRREGIDTTFIFAVVGDNLQMSVRSQQMTLDVQEFCGRVFGRDKSGGKHGSGGVDVPLGIMTPTGDAEIRGVVYNAIKQKVFHLLEKELEST